MLTLTRLVVKSIVTVVTLVVVAWAGWQWGDRVFPRLELALGVREAPAAGTPSQAAADEAIRRWERFAEEEGQRELLVSDVEATSVLRHGLPGLLPVGVSDPQVQFQAGGMKISGRVARRAFSDLRDLGGVLEMLPDTVSMEMDAVLIPFEGDETALVVRRITASGIPLPRSMVPRILDALGRQGRPGLPPEAIVVPLPDEVIRAYVLSDTLHLVGRP